MNIVFVYLGVTYRTNADASRVQRYNGPLAGWMDTGSMRIMLYAQRVVNGEEHAD